MTVDPLQSACSPVLVLGVGNRLLRDDGLGLELLDRLVAEYGTSHGIDFVDGGTQGLALLGLLDGRRAVLVLDALRLDSPPGSVHVVDATSGSHAPRSTTAHESCIHELLNVARLVGSLPPTVVVVGIEPEVVRTGIGLSESVTASVPRALEVACERLAVLCDGALEVPQCTN